MPIRSFPVVPTNLPDEGVVAAAPSVGLLKWVPRIGLGTLLLVLARQAAQGLSDPDAPWHVLAGRFVSQTWQFSGPDPFSTVTNQDWIMGQWLPELAMAAADRVGGLPGVVFLSQVGITAVVIAVYLLCRQTGDPLAAVMSTALCVLGTSGSLSPRPQLVGFVLLAVTTGAWLGSANDLKPRWWLVPVTWIWACSHGTWVIGVLVGAVLTLAIAMENRLEWRRCLRLGAVPALSLCAAMATPVGPRLLESLLVVNAIGPYVQEWRRTELGSTPALMVLLMILVVVYHWIRGRRAFRWSHAALLAMGLAWALWHQRTVGVGAILTAPVACAALGAAVGRTRAAIDRAEGLGLAVVTALCLVLSAALAAAGPREIVGVPHAFDATLRSLPAGAVVYNEDSLGGWLMYSYPSLGHTFDTRVELYGPKGVRDYFTVMRARPGWQAVFDRAKASVVVISEDEPLASALLVSGWATTGRDEGFVMLERHGG